MNNGIKRQLKAVPLVSMMWSAVRFALRGPLPRQVFAISLYGGPELHELESKGRADTPILTAEDVTDLDAEFIADPFLLRRGNDWYLFFEVLPAYDGRGPRRGVIGLATSHDAGSSWTYEQIVIKEPFHLSYPHVLEWEGKVYMVPEARESGAIRLYEASEFPVKWKHVADLLQGTFTDATPFYHGGSWWMFAESAPQDPLAKGAPENSILRLFFADSLTGPWSEHPCSPIVSGDTLRARPAGRVIITDYGKLIRLSQDCTDNYGEAVYALEITKLRREAYEERLLSATPVLAGTGRSWNADGMHHMDVQRDEDEWIAVVDGWRFTTPG